MVMMVSVSMSLAARVRSCSRIFMSAMERKNGKQDHTQVYNTYATINALSPSGSERGHAHHLLREKRQRMPCWAMEYSCGHHRGLATEVQEKNEHQTTKTPPKPTTRGKAKPKPKPKPKPKSDSMAHTQSRAVPRPMDSRRGMTWVKEVDAKIQKNETFHFDLSEHTWPPAVVVDANDDETSGGKTGSETTPLKHALYMAEGISRRVVDELEASGSDSLLNTKVMVALQKDVFHSDDKYAASAPAARKLLLKGSDGVGKTCCLLTLAAKARHEYGWIVVYVPDVARSFLSAGTYMRRRKGGSADGWDTPEAAAALMRGIQYANTNLAAVRTKTPEGQKLGANLLEAVEAAARLGEKNMEAESFGPRMDGSAAVDAAAAVFRELMQPAPGEVNGVLIAMDNYDALFGDSEFYESVSLKKRRKIRADELNLVRAWREIGRGGANDKSRVVPTKSTVTGSSAALPKVIFIGATSGRHDYCTPTMASDEEVTTLQPWGVFTTAMYMVRRRLGMQPSLRARSGDKNSAAGNASSSADIGDPAASSPSPAEYSVSAIDAARFNSVTGGHPLTTRTSFL